MKNYTKKLEDFFTKIYKQEIGELCNAYPDKRSLVIDFFELEKENYELADFLVEDPQKLLPLFKEAVENINTSTKKAKVNVRVANLTENVELSQLLSKYIGRFVSVDGIVRKTDEVRPRIDEAVFECSGCMIKQKVKQVNDNLSSPIVCNHCGNKSFNLIQSESVYVDTQTVRIQEPLETLSGGTEPRQILLILEDDLVDEVKPGEKIRVTGTLETTKEKRTGRFRNYIYVNYIEHLEQEFEELNINQEDEERIIELSQDPLIYDKIISSTAPSIKGYDSVKEAIALQLFGGSVKELEDNTRIRGDIHILIIGDPGIGKSQMLKYVSKLAPRGVYTSGKGTSGAGLTAAAVRDELGGWSLEAGALVLGDKGNVCVDELDKMRSEDRSALHEALEQQTVSIAKAGIMATLNTRCSVLAAANPKFGRFDNYKSVADQIDLPAPILSRFDLIFVIEDKPDVKGDRDLAKHILKTHREESVEYKIDPELLRKYIGYAHNNYKPKLTKKTSKIIEDFYVDVRKGALLDESPVPITPRQLEAIIRLAEASARLHLKDDVGVEDVYRAIRLQQECLKQVGYDPNTGKIDIDKVEGRTPKSYRDKFNLILDLVKNMESEHRAASVSHLANIVESEHDIDREMLDDLLLQLKKKGVIYESKKGEYRQV